MELDVRLFMSGGRSWHESLEEALRKADVPSSRYKEDEEEVIRQLVRKGVVAQATIADPQNPYSPAPFAGTRWEGLLALVERTEYKQPIINLDARQFFPPGTKQRLLKKSVKLPVKRWETEPPANNPTVREGLEAAIEGINITRFRMVTELPVAFDIEGVRTNNLMKVTSPFDWIRGGSAYSNEALRSRAKITNHIGREDYSDILVNGMLVVAENVPTLSGDTEPHKVTLTQVPVYHIKSGITKFTKIAGRDMMAQDDCFWDTFSDYKYGSFIRPAFGRTERVRRENTHDHHAYFTLLLARDWIRAGHPELSMDFPYPEVPERVKRLVEIAYRRVVVTTREQGKGDESVPSIKREPIWESVAWMKIYTMMAVAYVNTKKLQEQRALEGTRVA